MAGKRSKIQRLIDKLDAEIQALTDVRYRLIQIETGTPAPKRKAKRTAATVDERAS